MNFLKKQVFVITLGIFGMHGLNAASSGELATASLSAFFDKHVENRQKIVAMHDCPIKVAIFEEFDRLIAEICAIEIAIQGLEYAGALVERVQRAERREREMKFLIDSCAFAAEHGLVISEYVPYQSIGYTWPNMITNTPERDDF